MYDIIITKDHRYFFIVIIIIIVIIIVVDTDVVIFYDSNSGKSARRYTSLLFSRLSLVSLSLCFPINGLTQY